MLAIINYRLDRFEETDIIILIKNKKIFQWEHATNECKICFFFLLNIDENKILKKKNFHIMKTTHVASSGNALVSSEREIDDEPFKTLQTNFSRSRFEMR